MGGYSPLTFSLNPPLQQMGECKPVAITAVLGGLRYQVDLNGQQQVHIGSALAKHTQGHCHTNRLVH